MKPTLNLKWIAQTGHGFSRAAPVTSEKFVWLGTNNENPRDPNRTEPAPALMCFRETDGAFIWQYLAPVPNGRRFDASWTGIKCSPLIEGDNLWFTTPSAEVICLDIGPLRRGEGLPVELGGQFAGTNIFHIQWSSPLALNLDGTGTVIAGFGDGWLRAFTAPTGERLWELDCNPQEYRKRRYPSPDGRSEILAAPTFHRGHVYVAIGQEPEHGDGLGNLVCVDAISGKLIWQNQTIQRSIDCVP
jgi:outer membrane protein assembly factor BamB